MGGKTLQEFFAGAAQSGALVEIYIDHPREDFQRQSGIVYEAHAEFAVIGPEGAPARICLPYAAMRWFRRLDDAV
jgi:hypothetical protein